MVDSLAVRIRAVRETDLPALEWDGEYVHFRKVYRQAMRDAQRDRRLLYLAETTGEVIGQLFVHLHSVWKASFGGARAGYLHSFRVKPGYRNRGIGSRLLGTAEGALLTRNYSRAVISVARGNTRAQELYHRHGYRMYCEDPGEWAYVDHHGKLRHVNEPAYIMVKALSNGNPPYR